MKKGLDWKQGDLRDILLFFLPFVLFWVVLLIKIPYAFSHYLSAYYLVSFLIVLLLYYLCYRLPNRYGIFASLCLSMILLALTLSYQWTSGYSDNMVIGGLLPYKDAKNYYYGAKLILNGMPMINAGQSTERPLFPGFLSALFLLTDQNLKIVLAIITQLIAVGLFFSARQILDSLGGWAASIYITFAYFYIQPVVGHTLSELLGFLLGCFAFCLLWRASYSLKWLDLLLGLFVLLMAVSARAGAFFIFPALAGWVGWIFRGEKRFSLKKAAYVFIAILAGYVLLNRFYAQLLGIPPGAAFGNFSYAIYGQVRGGTGWHSAIEELGTRNPSAVYHAALQFFLKHPASLLIGFAKAYRDFFLPGGLSIFPFKSYGWQGWFDIVMGLGAILLLVWGFLGLLKNIHKSDSALMAAGFIGVFLSIPFLPPIDGGARFYASTMPFVFVLPAVGVARLSREFSQDDVPQSNRWKEMFILRLSSVTFLVLTLLIPIGIYTFRQRPAFVAPACPSHQIPFVIESPPRVYIDLIKDGTTRCGFLPEVCLSDFERNNTEKLTDDYYHTLMSLVASEDGNVRIIPALDLVEQDFHYFFVPDEKLSINSAASSMSGCAVEIKTKNQSIYYVESMMPTKK